jgi:plastocyanin
MKHFTRVMAPLALAGALVISACGDDDADDGSDTDTTMVTETETETDENAEAADGPAPDEVTVVVDGFAFAPAEVRVAAGGTVTWDFVETNHTVVIDGVTLSPGGETSITFDTSGTYPYVCGIHSSMSGTVVVV